MVAVLAAVADQKFLFAVVVVADLAEGVLPEDLFEFLPCWFLFFRFFIWAFDVDVVLPKCNFVLFLTSLVDHEDFSRDRIFPVQTFVVAGLENVDRFVGNSVDGANAFRFFGPSYQAVDAKAVVGASSGGGDGGALVDVVLADGAGDGWEFLLDFYGDAGAG